MRKKEKEKLTNIISIVLAFALMFALANGGILILMLIIWGLCFMFKGLTGLLK
jgi:hypothetical protein